MGFCMNMGKGIRLAALLMAVFLCLSVFPSARAEYDPAHPEILEAQHLTATSAILINADTGKPVFQKNATAKMYPASTTKIMTVLVVLEMMQNNVEALKQKCLVTESAVNLAEDESTARLKAWEEVPLIDLLYAAILPSGNDAANAIAENLGGMASFAERMNAKALELGCKNTHFTNAHGLHDEEHYTTAEDMALIAMAAMKNEIFREIVAASSYAMSSGSRSVSNRNDFLNPNKGERYYVYGTGIKTGTTSAAGNCFVGSATKDGINLISVVFNASKDANRYLDTIKLMEYGFSQYEGLSIAELYLESPRVVDIARFALDDPEVGRLTLSLQPTPSSLSATPLVLTQEEKAQWIQQFYSRTVTEFTRELVAPIAEGEVMGTLTYYAENDVPVIYELVASRSIEARISTVPTLAEIIAAAENDPNPFPRLTFELVFIHLILPAAALWLLIRGIRKLLPRLKRKHKPKAFKPTGRFYR